MTDAPSHPLPAELVDEGNKPIPTWQKWTALGFVVVWAAIVWLWHSRAGADFYPLDASRVAPNLLASFVIFSLGLVAGALLWPPVRKRIHRAANIKLAALHDSVHSHLSAVHATVNRHHVAHMAEHAETRRHVAHLLEQQGLAPVPAKQDA